MPERLLLAHFSSFHPSLCFKFPAAPFPTAITLCIKTCFTNKYKHLSLAKAILPGPEPVLSILIKAGEAFVTIFLIFF